MTTNKITTRPMRDSDLNFMLRRWLVEYKDHGEMIRRVRDREYFSTYEPILKAIIPNNSLIACLGEEPDVIIGFICAEQSKNLIHWIYVKESWRDLKIAKKLFTDAGLTLEARFTHWTRPVNSIVNKFPNLTYNPWALMMSVESRRIHGRIQDAG